MNVARMVLATFDEIMKKRKIIILDFDGVIVDSRELALEYTQKQYEGVTEEIHRNLFCGNIFTEMEKLKSTNITKAELDNFLEKSYWPRKKQLPPIKDMDKIIERLNKTYEIVINTSSDSRRVADYLEKWNLLHYFKKIYGKDTHKSKVEKFKLILKEFGVGNKDCILVTDTIGDIIEAQVAGIGSVGVSWGYQQHRHFISLGREITLIEQPADLMRAIEEHFKEIN